MTQEIILHFQPITALEHSASLGAHQLAVPGKGVKTQARLSRNRF